ncbi:hypothetical protein B0H11DRAFT_2321572 [Mycena galericulata]|nr:hypothetical protein B0H11DRAFT_2321572 [Mycena galericulata]
MHFFAPSPFLPDALSHIRLPVDLSAWPNPSARSNVATSSTASLPAGITFPDPWRGKSREDSDAPWWESPSVDAPANGVDTVSAAFLQLLEAHRCGADPKEELLNLVDWGQLLRLAAASSSHVLRYAASCLMPSTTSARHLQLDHSPNSLTTNATRTLSDLDGLYHSAADTTPRTGTSDYELLGMQPSSFSNSAGKVRFGSGSGPLALNAEPEPRVRFRPALNLEPERALRFGSAFERVRN